MTTLNKLNDFTKALLENYFDSLKEIGNRQFNVSATVTPYDKFRELRRKKEIRESISQAKALIESFHTEHTTHVETFWSFVKELGIQEVEAKKVIDTQFINFQNRAWNVIKMLKRRAEDRLDEFEEFEVDENKTKQRLTVLKDLTFEILRDSWITQIDPIGEDI